MISLLDAAVTYDFREGELPLTLKGFCQPEHMGCWSVDEIAEISLSLPVSDNPFVAVVFDHSTHVRQEVLLTQRVVVSVDGQFVEEWTLRDEWYRKRAIVIDKALLKDRSKATITLSLPDSLSPQSYGFNDDGRRLGIMVRRLYVLDLSERPDSKSALSQIGRRYVGTESRKTWDDKHLEGFWSRFICGPKILDIGFASYGDPNVKPIMEGAIGVDIDFPGYDGRTLPFEDESQDTVYSSHCLEHIPDPLNAIQDWYRVTRQGGYIIIAVPNRSLYERRRRIPSRWNREHLRMYTPASLLAEIEAALEPNSYRLRSLTENDGDYNYSLTHEQHPSGIYEIEAVIQKIAKPIWKLED